MSRPLVLLAPSLGRPVSDFDHLAEALSAGGFEPVGVDLCSVTGAADLHAYAAGRPGTPGPHRSARQRPRPPRAHPDRVELVETDGAGHALLPEQPEAIAAAVLDFLRRHEG